jgi:hypothetical protein
MALPQIEWVNIFIEPANTPLSVIPAEAGIQCLLVPGRWITEYIHVFCPSGQLSLFKSAPGRFSPAKNVQE